MRYRELELPADLRTVVRAVWRLEGAPVAGGTDPIIPDGCVELVLNLGAAVDDVRADGEVRRQPAAMIAGVADAPTVIAPTGTIDIWGIRLQPWGARAFLGVPAWELRRETMSLADVAAPLARALTDALDPDGGAGRAPRLLRALVDRLARMRAPSATSVALSSRALDGCGTTGVRELAREAGLGVRRVQAIFSEEIGAGPKLLMRLGRFQRALSLAREANLPWGAIAARAGYFDHAHLIRDARQFAGCTPSELFPARPSLTEVFLA